MRAKIYFCIEVDDAEEQSSLTDYLKALQIKFHTDAMCLPPEAPEAKHNPLSPAEQRLLESLLYHDTINAAARAICISPNTARKHLENIYCKLQVHSLHRALTVSLCSGYITTRTAEPTGSEDEA